MKRFVFRLFPILFLLVGYATPAQLDTVLLQIHPSVGDTLDAYENYRFQIVTTVAQRDFKSARYLKVGDEIILQIDLLNNEQLEYPKTEAIMQEEYLQIDSIINKDDRRKSSGDKPSRKLYVQSKTRQIRLKNGRKIMLAYEDETGEVQWFKVKIKEVVDQADPVIKVKNLSKNGSYSVIALEDIRKIQKYSAREYNGVIGSSVVSMLFGVYGLFEVKQYPESIPGIILLEAYGVFMLTKGNPKFDLQNGASFEFKD